MFAPALFVSCARRLTFTKRAVTLATGWGRMTDFEGLFGLFGLMFGLIVAELALKFADAIDSNRERPMGRRSRSSCSLM